LEHRHEVRERAAGAGPARLTQTSFKHQHWTVAQMLAHHTVGVVECGGHFRRATSDFAVEVALGIGVFFAIVWLLGGIFYSNIGNTLTYYLIGIGVLLLYIPLYYYRTKVEDKRVGEAEPGRTPVTAIHEK